MIIIIDLVGHQPHIEGQGEATIITIDVMIGDVESAIAKTTVVERLVIGLSLIHIFTYGSPYRFFNLTEVDNVLMADKAYLDL